MRCLAELGADLNLQDKSGRTALLCAILCGVRDEVVLVLLEKGADPFIETFRQEDYAYYIKYKEDDLRSSPFSNRDDDAAERKRLENISRHFERYAARRSVPDRRVEPYTQSSDARSMQDVPGRSMDSYMQSRNVQPSRSKLGRLFRR